LVLKFNKTEQARFPILKIGSKAKNKKQGYSFELGDIMNKK